MTLQIYSGLKHDITFADIQQKFHAIVLACGIEGEKKLGVPNELSLSNIYSARDFVSWLNGHPDFQKKQFSLDHEDIVIVGQGNVALDVARMLLKPISELATTDIAQHALDLLAKSKVRNVHIVGRRGPAQVSFTNKEVREILKLPNVTSYVNEPIQFTPEDQLFQTYLKPIQEWRDKELKSEKDGKKNLIFHFQRSPTSFEGRVDGGVQSVRLEKNRLDIDAKGRIKAVGTGEVDSIDCGTVFRSIGYTGTKFDQVPFDFQRVCIPNVAGRVLQDVEEGSPPIPGLYVSGWIKSGPTGAILNVSVNAEETAHTIKDDCDDKQLYNNTVEGYQGIVDILKSKQHNLITFDDWKKIESEEFKRGKEKGKIMDKIIVFDELKNIIQH
eukprot:gene10920-12727_t